MSKQAIAVLEEMIEEIENDIKADGFPKFDNHLVIESGALKRARSRIEALNGASRSQESTPTTDELLEELGKKSCYISFIYPNAGKWHIQAKPLCDDTFSGETIAKALLALREKLAASQ